MRRTSVLFFLMAVFLLSAVFFELDISSLDNIKVFGEFSRSLELGKEKTLMTSSSILFTGDVLLARDVEYMMHTYGFSYPFKDIQSVLDSSDVIVINFESAIPLKHSPTPSLNTQFSVRADQLAALSKAGITHASLANNHTFDYGISGLENTKKELASSSIITFGDPFALSTSTITYVEFEQNKWRVALIGINAATKYPDAEILQRVLKNAAEQSDIQIVMIHWGNEYIGRHHHGQEWFAHTLADAGADIIIGHHPHVVQDIELYNDTLIFYSLGNFIFDQYFSNEVQNGLLVEIVFADEVSFQLIPVTSVGSKTVQREMAPFERDAFLTDLAEKSSPKLKDAIKSGIIIPSKIFVQ